MPTERGSSPIRGRNPSLRAIGKFGPRLAAALLILATTASGCAPVPEGRGEKPAGEAATPAERALEIARERAIEIARPQVTFDPLSIEAVAEDDEGRPVWRVTFRGRPPGPEHAIGELQEFLIDRRTGEIVSLSTS